MLGRLRTLINLKISDRFVQTVELILIFLYCIFQWQNRLEQHDEFLEKLAQNEMCTSQHNIWI